MAGLNLQTGLTGSVVGGLYGGGGAVSPPRTGVPEGPSAAAMAYGAGGGQEGQSSSGMHACVIGGLAIALLLFMWWGLPR
jgi:hypothetical protein